MGLLDLHAAQAGITEPPLQALPRTLGERVEASAAETFAPDRYFNINRARRDMWQRSIDELHGTTGTAFANPYEFAPSQEEMLRLGSQPAITAERSQKIIEAARAARETNPDLFDPENIDRYIGEESNRRRQTAGQMQGTGNGVVNFLASAALETATPHGIVGLAIPVTRLPLAASSAVGRTFLGNVGREAAFQAGANAGLQAGAEGLDYLSRSETGTAQTLGEVVTNIAGAAVIGGFIGGGVRALHLKWLGLPEKVRADAPLEVKDAFRAIEADVLYSGQNRLGVDPLLHERYQGNAMDAVMRGRPVDLADLSRTADTPLTALGTILRQQVDQPDIRVRDPSSLFERMGALPDSEITAFAREVRPNSFARLDKVEAEIAAARAQLAELDRQQPSIAELVDPDTAMRLQDIEQDLAAPALTRKEKTALERERDMILSTVDPKDRLPKQAEKALRAERAKIEAAIARLEGPRTEALETANKATADLRRKLERYADRIEPQEAARDLGFTEPAGLGAALARADILRQARMLREILPEGVPPRTADVDIKVNEPMPPEQVAALKTETARLVEARPDLEVEIDGRTMSATKAMEEADRLDKEASIAMNCAIGAM